MFTLKHLHAEAPGRAREAADEPLRGEPDYRVRGTEGRKLGVAEDRQRICLILEARPGPVPAEVRLRRALKDLLRSFGPRVVSVEDVREEPPVRYDKDGQRG
jgi:hypothetical protein